MKSVRTNYHALLVLKTAEPRLRKALLTYCNKELVNCISECVECPERQYKIIGL